MEYNKEGFCELDPEYKEKGCSTDREKELLWPILAALGVERKKWEKFKYFPDQLVGLSIACVKERDREIASLRKKNHDLKKTLDEFKQQNFDFRRCPIPTMRKL